MDAHAGEKSKSFRIDRVILSTRSENNLETRGSEKSFSIKISPVLPDDEVSRSRGGDRQTRDE